MIAVPCLHLKSGCINWRNNNEDCYVDTVHRRNTPAIRNPIWLSEKEEGGQMMNREKEGNSWMPFSRYSLI
jgi:hypothetical protein